MKFSTVKQTPLKLKIGIFDSKIDFNTKIYCSTRLYIYIQT